MADYSLAPMASDAIRSAFAQFGPGSGLLYLFGRTLQRFSGGRAKIVRYHFVAQPVPTSPLAAMRPSAKTRVRLVTREDPVVAHFPRPRGVLQRRFDSGAECLVIESDGEFAGFLWLAYRSYDEDEVRCRYRLAHPESSAWDYDVYIVPRFRIGRSFARLWTAANAHLSGQGIKWSISRISAFNPDSLAAHRALGIRPIGTATFICLGPLQLSFFASAPYLHLGMSHTDSPAISLQPPGED
jgi:hypothetical protein